jgi:hypothetical protein
MSINRCATDLWPSLVMTRSFVLYKPFFGKAYKIRTARMDFQALHTIHVYTINIFSRITNEKPTDQGGFQTGEK